MIPVLPKNCRSIVIRAIEISENPLVFIDNVRISDFSTLGPLTRKNFMTFTDLEVRDGAMPIVGFHDHPREMWINGSCMDFAEYCSRQGWLKIQRKLF